MRLSILPLLLLFPLAAVRAQQVVKSEPTVSPALQARANQLVDMLRDANDLLDKGDDQGALAKVNTVLHADPRSLAAYVLRGTIYSKEKQWEKAQGDYEAAHLINPHSAIVQYDLAQVLFVQKQYDAARPAFLTLESERETDIGDLAAYKVFLCDLFGGHEDLAARELAAFNDAGTNPSYYFSNAAWDLYHHKTEDARGWLLSAGNIYSVQKNGFYVASLFDTGYLPIPPAAPAGK